MMQSSSGISLCVVTGLYFESYSSDRRGLLIRNFLVKESAIEDLRRQFDVNVFGPVAVMQAVLPYMRRRRAGHIINITSMGGIITMPGIAFYHGSKFALEGISESLGKEISSFGIHVTAVEPGWAGRSMVRAERKIADYYDIFEPHREARLSGSGKQPDDPRKAAPAILQSVASNSPPTHLLLGRDGVDLVREKLGLLKSEFDAWERVSRSTDFAAWWQIFE
jgi:NAD(P)-dependent dehydrogenase (short-subunit alcohol dehydrogenase family)